MRLTLNLASRRYVNERALKWGYFLLALLLIAILFFQVRTTLHNRRLNLAYHSEIASLKGQLGDSSPVRFSAAQIAAQKQAFSRAQAMLQEDAFRWTALFDRMEGLLPNPVSLRSFSPNYKDGSLLLTGVARELNDLQQLLNNLHADTFEQVFLQSQRQVSGDGLDKGAPRAIEFTLRLEGVFQ